MPLALAASRAHLDALLGGRRDRVAAFLDEGRLDLPETASALPANPARATRRRQRAGAARSLAELTLFEALEATSATTGRFVLNGHITAQFGGSGAEVDLLAREDALAIEIDGYHHFRDAERYRRDRRKDALLQLHGLCVLRFLADDILADVRPALAAVSEVLAQRLRTTRTHP
jgi:very-short-patch-repair endonuclease